MKDLQTKEQKNSVHSHIDIAFELINANLPVSYVSKVRECLKHPLKNSITDDVIRNVRHRRQIPENQPEVFSALIAVAKAHKEFKDSIAKSVE